MFKVNVQRVINRPVDTVFSILSDHAQYTRFKGITAASLVQRGHSEPNGVGAIRLIESGWFKFREVITEFERPLQFAYHIEWSRPLRIVHELGLLEFEAINSEQTQVVWRSEGHMQTPVLGRFLFDPLVEKQLHKAFGAMLKSIEAMDLESLPDVQVQP